MLCGATIHERELLGPRLPHFNCPVLPNNRRLRIDCRLDRLERDASITVETMAAFIRFWRMTNPPLPEPAQAAAKAQAGKSYDAFVAALGRRLTQGPALRQEISEDVLSTSD